jgi:hypothetical protein
MPLTDAWGLLLLVTSWGRKISLVMVVSRNNISFVSAETLEVDFVVILSIDINKLQY